MWWIQDGRSYFGPNCSFVSPPSPRPPRFLCKWESSVNHSRPCPHLNPQTVADQRKKKRPHSSLPSPFSSFSCSSQQISANNESAPPLLILASTSWKSWIFANFLLQYKLFPIALRSLMCWQQFTVSPASMNDSSTTFVFFLLCIRSAELIELGKFNWNQSSMTEGYWKLFCVSLSQLAQLVYRLSID